MSEMTKADRRRYDAATTRWDFAVMNRILRKYMTPDQIKRAEARAEDYARVFGVGDEDAR